MVKLDIELESGDAINEVVSRKEVIVRSNTASSQGLSCLTTKKMESTSSSNSETSPTWTAVTLKDIILAPGQELVFDFAPESEVLSVTLGGTTLMVGDFVLLKKQMASSFLCRLNKGITSLIPPFNPIVLSRQVIDCGRIIKFISRGAVLRSLSSEQTFFVSNEELMFSTKAKNKTEIENLRRTFSNQLDVLPGDRVELGGSRRLITSCRIPLHNVTQKKVTLEGSPLVAFSVESLKNITRDAPCKNPPKATIKTSGPRSYTLCFFTRDCSSVVGSYVENGTLHMEIIDPLYSRLSPTPVASPTKDQSAPQQTLIQATSSAPSIPSFSSPLSTLPSPYSSIPAQSRSPSVPSPSLPVPLAPLLSAYRLPPVPVVVRSSSGPLLNDLSSVGSKRRRSEDDEQLGEPLNKVPRQEIDLCPR